MISSTQNPKIKYLFRLFRNKTFRKKQGVFFVEERYMLPYLKEFTLKEVFYHGRSLTPEERSLLLKFQSDSVTCTELSKDILRRLLVRDAESLLFLYEQKSFLFKKSSFSSAEQFLAVLDGVEKPGNVGAMMRTMLAMNASALIIMSDSFDLYSPNLIRAARGASFRLPVFLMAEDEVEKFLVKNSFSIACAVATEGQSLFSYRYGKKQAVFFGSEAFGLREKWLSRGFDFLNIPLFNQVDSLNVSVSLSLLLYEFRKQYPLEK